VDKSDSHNILFHVHSPLEVLQLLHLNGTLALEKGSYRLILDGTAGNNTAEVDLFFKVQNQSYATGAT